ncbi:MAG: thermonuclease family protein [Pseudomonadota bacterium]
MRTIFLIAAILAMAPVPASAGEAQIAAVVTRVVDGDTIDVEAKPWPGMRVDARIRLPDIQAPETFRPDCDEELQLGMQATEWLRERVEGKTVWLADIRPGKYGGRFIARVTDNQGDLAAALVAAGMAEPWNGDGATRPSYCSP